MSFDKWIIVIGVLTALVTAISPVVIAVIGKSTPRNRMKNTRVVQGMAVDMTADFVEFLKNEIDEEKLEKDRAVAAAEARLGRAEKKIRELRMELRLAHEVLNRNGLPIPVVYRPEDE